MKRVKLDSQEIDRILNDSLDADYWFYQLGLATTNADTEGQNYFNFPFEERGKKMWAELLDRVKLLFCDIENGTPKPNINSRDSLFIEQTVIVISSWLDDNIGAAIAFYSLSIRFGIDVLCAQ